MLIKTLQTRSVFICMYLFCRDDDDINDVASMAGVNLNEENARILATGSELVGTQIRSCKDEPFLQANLLHKRILDIGMNPKYTVLYRCRIKYEHTYQFEHTHFTNTNVTQYKKPHKQAVI